MRLWCSSDIGWHAACMHKTDGPTHHWGGISKTPLLEARSSPGLSAWFVIRTCSQERSPHPVRQETPEPHKQMRRRRDGVAAPWAAGRDRLLYGLGERLWSAAKTREGTRLVVLRSCPCDGLIEACVRVLVVRAVHRADGGLCEAGPDESWLYDGDLNAEVLDFEAQGVAPVTSRGRRSQPRCSSGAIFWTLRAVA
jgi:hypothetical protein